MEAHAEDWAKKYFEAWNAHDLVKLKKLMCPTVVLWDWENKVEGLEKVIQVNDHIFSSAPQINATIIELYKRDLTVCAELKIMVSKSESIDVVDILRFSRDGRLASIKAYKC